MKKTKHIHLVLVTAVLASCNRVVIPDRPEGGYTPDSSLTAAPLYDDYRYDCDCRFDTTYNQYPDYGYSNIYLSFYYTGQPYGYPYYPGQAYRKNAFWHHRTFIVRGGFGKSALSQATAAS